MKVRDVMTEPALSCTPDTSLSIAARRMEEADYGTLPVVDRDGRIVGIITDRDICLAFAHSDRNATHITVHEVMTPTVSTTLTDDDLQTALATMKHARVRRLPVCDGTGRLVGIISIEDVVVRGLQGNGIDTDDLVAALQAMYVRTPVAVRPAAGTR